MSRLTFDPSCGLDIATTTIHRLEDIATISYWGYRVVEHAASLLYIHEAYYDHREGIIGIARQPATLCGESMDEVRESLDGFTEALNEPTLHMADFLAEDKPHLA